MFPLSVVDHIRLPPPHPQSASLRVTAIHSHEGASPSRRPSLRARPLGRRTGERGPRPSTRLARTGGRGVPRWMEVTGLELGACSYIHAARRGGVRRVVPWPSTAVPFAPKRATCVSTYPDFIQEAGNLGCGCCSSRHGADEVLAAGPCLRPIDPCFVGQHFVHWQTDSRV
eukprot:216703-Prymnesium_polylepis.1